MDREGNIQYTEGLELVSRLALTPLPGRATRHKIDRRELAALRFHRHRIPWQGVTGETEYRECTLRLVKRFESQKFRPLGSLPKCKSVRRVRFGAAES